MRLASARSGLIFSTILLIGYFIAALSALVALYFLLFAKLPDESVGAYQSALLSAYERSEQKLFYLERSAEISLDNSLALLKDDQRAFFAQEGDGDSALLCGSYAYQLWNAEGSCLLGSHEERLQMVLDSLEPRVREQLGDMLLRYPGGNFNVPYELSAREQGDELLVHFGVSEQNYLTEPLLVNFDVQETASVVKQVEDVFSGKTTTQGLAYPSKENIVTSCFGIRRGVDGASGSSHMGMDLPKGEVYAAKDGTVLNQPPGTAGTVWLKHGDELSTRYLHLDPSSIRVSQGDFVKQGELIGIAKSTGCTRSSGAPCGEHLHFEVLVPSVPGSGAVGVYTPSATPGWYAVNPMCFFSNDQVAILEKYDTGSSCDRQRDWKTEFCSSYGFKSVEHSPEAVEKETPEVPLGEEPQDDAKPPADEIIISGLTTTQQNKLRLTQQRLTPEIQDWVRQAANEYSLDESLILGVITQESVGEADVISSDPCCAGIMQINHNTAKNIPGLSGHVTPCQCTRKGPGCFCNRGNDRRLDPKYAIPGGAWLLRDEMNLFSDQTDQIAFTIASYNAGSPVIRKAIRELGNDPSWSKVASHLRTNPQIISYISGTKNQQAKVEQLIEYVDEVMAYVAAWNGGEVIDKSRPQSIAQVHKQYGDIKKVGDYTYDPSMTVKVPNELAGYLNIILWASNTVDECRVAENPQECLLDKMDSGEVVTTCEEDEIVQYFSELYQSLFDCQENLQSQCQCQLPHPPSVEGSYSLVLDINLGEGVILHDDSRIDGLYLDGINQVLMQQEEGFFTTEMVTHEPDSLIFSYKDGLISLRYEEDGDVVAWTTEWLAEAESGLVFKKERESEMLCAPVKSQYALCSNDVKFAITLKDDAVPVVEVSYDAVLKQVTLTPKSEDIGFYNVFVEGFTEVEMQVRGSFSAVDYVGETLRVIPVDLVGNQGEAVSVVISEVTP